MKKIIHITLHDCKGHIFNGYDLSEELNKSPYFVSKIFAFFKTSNNSYTKSICNKFMFNCIRLIRKIENFFSLQNILSPILFCLIRNKEIKNTDIIHFQLIQFNYFSLFMIPFFSKRKRVIWTFHDPWPLTGHCVHPQLSNCSRWISGCGKCPNLKTHFSIKRDTTHFLFNLKKKIFSKLKLEIVVASDYMVSLVSKSPIFKNSIIYKIPFGIKTNIFFPKNKLYLRTMYNIPDNKTIIFFRSDTSQFKGTNIIKNMFLNFDLENIFFITVGDIGLFENIDDKYPKKEFGWIYDDNILSDLYNISDIFLMPSKAESFGLMAVEAMACKIPVIAFDNTAMHELLSNNCGVLVQDENEESLFNAINNLINNQNYMSQIAANGLQKVLQEFTFDLWVKNIKKLYEH